MRSPASLSRHRTFRWNDGRDVDRYAAVETRDDGLLWYTWSHAVGAEGGRRAETLQSYDEFLRRGPPPGSPDVPPAPASVLAAVRAWIDEQR